MKQIIRNSAPVFLLVGLSLLPVQADPVPSAGRVLVLDNERTLEGDIERQGDQYRVKRTIGETWVPAAKVLRLCNNLDEALAYLRSRTNLGDPDERLRLARWCQQHDLRDQALAEVRAAVQLRPKHAESRRLLQNLERARATTVAAAPAEARPEPASSPAIDVDLEALGQFANKVQPILMNACANCHANGKGGDFKLVRAYGLSLGNRRATQQNLVSVFGQLNRAQWQASPFLTKAVAIHGEAGQAPLRGRQTEAYQALQDWVKLAVAKLPGGAEPATDRNAFAAGSAAPSRPPAEPFATDSKTTPPPETEEATPGQPAALEPADPFDPDIFNRQAHKPEKGQ